MGSNENLIVHPNDEISEERLSTLSAAQIEQHINHLKNEADRHWSIDSNISLKYAQQIIEIGQRLENPAYVALGMMARGDALKNLGQANQALEALDQAGSLYKETGDEVGWARTRIGMVYIAIDVKRVEATLAEAQTARQILLDAGQTLRCIYLEMNIATLFTRLGDSQSASQHYQAALELTHVSGSDFSFLLWPLHYNLAVLWTETGQLRLAEANFDEAIAIAREQNATRNTILALSARARLYIFQGKHRKALLMLHEARDLAQNGFPTELLFLQRIMAECYLYLNRYREARMLSLKSATAFETQGLYYETAISLFYVAEAEAQLTNFAEAVQSLERAAQHLLRSSQESHISLWKSRQYALHSRIALRQGDYPQAERWIQETLNTCAKGSVIEIDAMLSEVGLMIIYEQYDLARKYGEQTKQIALEKNLTHFVYRAHLLMASISERTGDTEQAVILYRDAISILEEAQKHLIISLQSDFLADKTEASHRLIHLLLQRHDIEQAFATLERKKSHVLLNYLSNRESLQWRRADQQTMLLLQKLDSLRAEYHWYMNLLHEKISPSAAYDSGSSKHTLQMQIASCEQQIKELTEQLYLLNETTPHSGAETIPALHDIQRILGKNDVLVEYYNDGKCYHAFVITADSLTVHTLPESSDIIDGIINKLQPNLEWALDADKEAPLYRRLLTVFQEFAHRLYENLIAWLEPALSDSTRLWIVPYGALHYVPFNCLYDGNQYLIEKHDLIILPTSSMMSRPHFIQPGGARVLAHSWNQAIPSTLLEAQAVQNLWGGEIYLEEEAQRSVLSQDPVTLLHIAAHGEYRIEVSELSYIQLGDGQLFMDDLLQEDLRYELVVLSGCETGRAKVMPGDELIGIGRGILVGGAASLIASLWRVDDDMMPQLIHALHQQLAAGMSKAQALREAQLSILREQPDCHPAYWGSLQLIGDPQPISMQNQEMIHHAFSTTTQ